MMKKILKEYDIPILLSLTLLPLLSIILTPIYIYYNGIVWQEPIMLFIGWFLAGTGITVGYHRLFSHRAFKTYPFVEWIYMFLGSMALQNTILNWCSDHRRHHKKLDTKDDPYSIKKGFFHAHIGWVVKKGNQIIENVSDLEKKSAIKFQNKYYWPMSISFSFILPILLGMIYDRPLGGLIWGGILRITFVHHFTFFINSFCHLVGKRTYDINTSARDSWIMALFTFGEGYHNFHHKFQWDYRNGIRWYNFDPSKWIINFLSFFKIAFNLRKASSHSIISAKLETLNKKIQEISLDSIYNNKIKKITNDAAYYLKLLKALEVKYLINRKKYLSSYEKINYSNSKKKYEKKLEESLGSLMIILYNLKNKVNQSHSI